MTVTYVPRWRLVDGELRFDGWVADTAWCPGWSEPVKLKR